MPTQLRLLTAASVLAVAAGFASYPAASRGRTPPTRLAGSRKGSLGRAQKRAKRDAPPPFRLAGDVGGLEAWLREGGAAVDGVDVAVFGSGLRGLVATRDIPAGAAVLSIPLGLAVTDAPSAFSEKFGGADGATLAWQARMAAQLVAVSGGAYAAALPSPRDLATLPHRIDETVLEDEAHNPQLLASADEAFFRAQLWHSELCDALKASSSDAAIAFADFYHAVDCIQSRTFLLEIGAPAGTSGGQRGLRERVEAGQAQVVRVMCPFIDLANHKCGAKSTVELVGAGDAARVELRSDTAHERGCQVWISYGERPSVEFAQFYGFVPETESPDDYVALKGVLSAPQLREVAAASPELAEELASFGQLEFRLYADGGVSDLTTLIEVSVAVAAASGGPSENSNAEVSAARSIAARLRADLDSWPTTAAEDRQLLRAPAPGLPAATAMLVVLRERRKRTLLLFAAAFERFADGARNVRLMDYVLAWSAQQVESRER